MDILFLYSQKYTCLFTAHLSNSLQLTLSYFPLIHSVIILKQLTSQTFHNMLQRSHQFNEARQRLLIDIPANFFLLIAYNSGDRQTAEKIFQCCSQYLQQNRQTDDSLYIELSFLSTGIFAVAIYGIWDDTKGLSLPWEQIPSSTDVYSDSKYSFVRKREYLEKLEEVLEAISL